MTETKEQLIPHQGHNHVFDEEINLCTRLSARGHYLTKDPLGDVLVTRLGAGGPVEERRVFVTLGDRGQKVVVTRDENLRFWVYQLNKDGSIPEDGYRVAGSVDEVTMSVDDLTQKAYTL